MIAARDAFARQIARLAERLNEGLPGLAAMLAMAPPGRGSASIDEARAGGCREAAALALLYPHHGRAHVVLTLRHAGLADHGGQVSLPGGRCEPDEEAVVCALRETAEELAVPPERVRVLGPLTPLYIPPSGHCVQAFLAATDERPAFRPAAGEVAAIIEVPLDHLVDGAYRRRELWTLPGGPQEVPFFAVGEHKVWGATAMMLSEVAALWSTCRDEEEPT